MGNLEENKALVQRYIDAYNRHDLAALDTILSPDYIDHAQPADQPPQPPGPAIKKQIYAIFFQSFPDARMTIEDMFAEGDRGSVRVTMSGTHRGAAFLGIPAKGKTYRVSASNVYRIRNGRITDSWSVMDMVTLLKQIEDPGFSGERVTTRVTTYEASSSTGTSEYWARWEYTPEEWKRFDQVDYGRATNVLLVVAVGVPLICMAFVAFVFMGVNSNPLQTSPDYSVLVIMVPMMLLMAFLLTFFLAGRRWWEARKRHLARKGEPRRVTIGVPSSLFHHQGLWIAGNFVPVQETFLELTSVRLTQNPSVLHLRRKHIHLRQSNWHDTLHILVPQGREAEAAHLVKHFQAETIAPLKQKPAHPEPA